MASADGFYWSVPKSGPNKGKKLWHYIPQKNLLAGTGWVSWDEAPPELRARFTRGQYTEKWDEGPIQQVATGRGPGDKPETASTYTPEGQRQAALPSSTTTDQSGMVPGVTDNYSGRNSAQQRAIDQAKRAAGGLVPDIGAPTSGVAGAAAGGLKSWLPEVLDFGGGLLDDYQDKKAREDAIAVSEAERQRLIGLSTAGMANVRGLQFNKPDLGQTFADPTNVFNRPMVRGLGSNGNPPQTYGNPAGDQYSSGNPYEQRNTAAYPKGGAPTSMGTPIVPPLQFASPEEIRLREEEERLRRGY